MATSDELLREALEAVRWKLVLCGGCGLRYRSCVKCGTGVKLVNGHRKSAADEVQCGGHEETPCDVTCIIRMALETERGDPEGEQPDEEMTPHAFNLRTEPQVGEEIREGIWCKDCAYHRDHPIHADPEGERRPPTDEAK